MQPQTKSFLNDSFIFKLVIFVFAALFVAWIYLNPFSTSDDLIDQKYIWGSSYQLLAFIGGVYGLFYSRVWNGWKSFLGRAMIFFSLGLLFQCVGQTVYSYFNLVARIEAPYPSFGDVGYFGSVIFYILGVFSLARVSGVRVSLMSAKAKIGAFVLPVVGLTLSYLLFLKDYEFDWSSKLKIFLDFGYPLGQAFYVSIAILVLVASRNYLGGVMKTPIMFFLSALIVQYVSDFNFLYQANAGTWRVGAYGDFLYAISYLLMSLAVIYMGKMFFKIQEA